MPPVRPSVTILCQNFVPETNAAARRITDLAHHLAASGWAVEVVTQAPHHPQNRVFDGYGQHYREAERGEHLDVVRFRPWIVPKDRFVLRILSEMLFTVQATAHAATRRRDLVIASSPFMFLGPGGLLAARLARARFAWDVRDLTWLYLAATGRRTYGVDRLIDRLMRFTARRADVLTTATDGLLAHFGARPSRSDVIPNGLSPALAAQLRDSVQRRASANTPHVMYAGLLGFPQGLAVLLDVAERMPDVAFSLVGDGPERPTLMADAQSRGLDNVSFPGYVPGNELGAWYGAADVLVAHLRRAPAFTMAQPSKLWEYMATGRPVVYGGEGEAVTILTECSIGTAVPPESPDAMAAAIRRLLDNPAEAARLGACGRDFVAEHRDRDRLVERWGAMLRDAVGG